MTRHEAKAEAIQIWKSYRKHVMDFDFGLRPDAPIDAEYSHQHGWHIVAGFSFCDEELYEAHTGHRPVYHNGD